MFGAAATIEQSQQFPVKCGDIFLESLADLTIYCSFCDYKLIALEEFLQHLQNNHLEHNSNQNDKILRVYDKNKLLDEDEVLDEQGMESFILAEVSEEESFGNDTFQENCDEVECLDIIYETEDNSNDSKYYCIGEESVSSDNYHMNCEEEESLGADFTQENCDDSSLDKYNEEDETATNNEEYINNTAKDLNWEIIKDKMETNLNSKVFDWDIETDNESSQDEVSNKPNIAQNKEENSSNKSKTKTEKSLKKSVEYSCPECQETFKLIMLLDDHIVYNHGGLKCTICHKRFGKRQHLNRHKTTHNTERIYSCNIEGCGKTFAVLDYYQQHMRNHRGSGGGSTPIKYRQYVCDQCGLSCTTSFSLKVHMRVHTGEKPFKCSYCEKRYISKSSLNNHLVSHKTIRNFICNICQGAFKTNIALKKHHLVHMDERNFKCELCNAAFKQPHGLLQHVQYVHKGKKDTRIRTRKK